MPFLNSARNASLTKTEEAIAAYIAENAEEVTRMSLHDLASASFASPASVTRLSRKLGFGSYSEMQVNIARELSENGSLVPIDADFPELDGSSTAKLAATLATLEVQSIRMTQRLVAPIASVTATEYVLNLLYLAVFDRARDKNALTLTESFVRQYDAMNDGTGEDLDGYFDMLTALKAIAKR